MSQRASIPESERAEQAALGSALIDPDYALAVVMECSADDFYNRTHRQIFEAIRDLAQESRTPDFVALSDLLESRHHEQATRLLPDLLTVVPSAVRVAEYVTTVKDRASRRRLLNGLGNLAQQCFDYEIGVPAIVDHGTALLRGETGGVLDQGTTAHQGATSVLAKAYYYYTNPIEPWQTRGIDTGYRDLNIALDGWKRGNVYYLLGLEHSGKTWMALNLVMNVCTAGGSAVFFSLEQATTADENPQSVTLWERVVLSQAGVPITTYFRGTLTDDEYDRLLLAGEAVSNWNLVMYDDRHTVPTMEAAVRSVARERGTVDLVAIDYLKLIRQPDERFGTRNEEIGGLTGKLKRMMLDLNVAGLVPHQVSSKALAARPNKRIALSDAYESGHLSQDADVVMSIYRDELFNPNTENPNLFELDILKDRIAGGTGQSVDLFFNKQTGRLYPVYTSVAEPGNG